MDPGLPSHPLWIQTWTRGKRPLWNSHQTTLPKEYINTTNKIRHINQSLDPLYKRILIFCRIGTVHCLSLKPLLSQNLHSFLSVFDFKPQVYLSFLCCSYHCLIVSYSCVSITEMGTSSMQFAGHTVHHKFCEHWKYFIQTDEQCSLTLNLVANLELVLHL